MWKNKKKKTFKVDYIGCPNSLPISISNLLPCDFAPLPLKRSLEFGFCHVFALGPWMLVGRM